jgi:hypothetical protein
MTPQPAFNALEGGHQVPRAVQGASCGTISVRFTFHHNSEFP